VLLGRSCSCFPHLFPSGLPVCHRRGPPHGPLPNFGVRWVAVPRPSWASKSGTRFGGSCFEGQPRGVFPLSRHSLRSALVMSGHPFFSFWLLPRPYGGQPADWVPLRAEGPCWNGTLLFLSCSIFRWFSACFSSLSRVGRKCPAHNPR